MPALYTAPDAVAVTFLEYATDIVMTLTPHVIRRSDITEADLRSFLVGGEASPFLFEVPSPGPNPPSAPRLDAPRVEPIRPPQPSTPPN